mgnify:FL=1
MILITGGAYQSKRRFAMERFALAPEDICDCARSAPDLSRRALCHVEQYVLRCVREGRDETALLREPALAEKILIFDDISCGVVPLEAEERAWRERTGRLAAALAQSSDEVWRVFFGLGERIK